MKQHQEFAKTPLKVQQSQSSTHFASSAEAADQFSNACTVYPIDAVHVEDDVPEIVSDKVIYLPLQETDSIPSSQFSEEVDNGDA